MAIKGNTDVIRREFYTGSSTNPTYYDPDSNLLTVKLLAPDQTEIQQISASNVTRAAAGKYDIKVTWTTHPFVYLVLSYTKDTVPKTRRYKVELSYYDSAQPFTEDSDGNFT